MSDKTERPRIRVAAIIVRGGAILLAQHRKDGKTYYVLPGGGVDFGETIEEALVRELKEEADLAIRIGRFVMMNDSIPPDKHRHIVNLYFTAEIFDGKIQVGTGDKRLVGMEFVPVSQLPGLTLYPDIRDELVRGLTSDFSDPPHYLGNLWKDV